MAWQGAGHRQGTELRYLDGGGAALLILALTEQAIGLHIIARHWHGLHHMQAVAVLLGHILVVDVPADIAVRGADALAANVLRALQGTGAV